MSTQEHEGEPERIKSPLEASEEKRALDAAISRRQFGFRTLFAAVTVLSWAAYKGDILWESAWEKRIKDAKMQWKDASKAELRDNVYVNLASMDKSLQKNNVTRQDIGVTDDMVEELLKRAETLPSASMASY